MSKPERELQVVEIATKEIVKVVRVTGSSDRRIEKVMRGMLINMDTDRFFVRDSADA